MVRESLRIRTRQEDSSPISDLHGQTTEDAIDLDSSDEEVEEIEVEEEVKEREEVEEEQEKEEADDIAELEQLELAASQLLELSLELSLSLDLDLEEEESVSQKEISEQPETVKKSEGLSLESEPSLDEEIESEKEEFPVETPLRNKQSKSEPEKSSPMKHSEEYDLEEMIRGEIAASLDDEITVIADDTLDSADDIAIVLVEPFSDDKKFLRRKRRKSEPDQNNPKVRGTDEHKTKKKAKASAGRKNLGSSHSDSEGDTELFVDALDSDWAGGQLTEQTSAFNLPNFPDVIEIESESEDSVAPKSGHSTESAGIRLLYNSSYDLSDLGDKTEVNLDTVTINELVGQKDLVETYQFNFSVDLEYFLSFLHPEFSIKRRKITFITGGPLLSGHPLENQLRKKFLISDVVASLPNRFGSHHSKMMVNFFEDDEVEIVIMTSNLTQLDFVGLTQTLWRSGRLKKGKTSTTLGKRFRIDLIRYLSKYKLNVTDALLKKLEHFDYSSVDVELVASAPGVYNLEDPKPKGEAYGYLKFRQCLKRNNLLLEPEKLSHNILAQVTSIAYPYATKKGKTSSIFTHLLCPLMFKDWDQLLEPGAEASQQHQRENRYKPHIVFPTAKEIASSNFGFLSGTAVHFKYTTLAIHEQQYEQNIKKYLCKWSQGTQTGRERVTPHVKYYACDNGDDWKSLKWVLVGSHNLSKQAWGYPLAKSKGPQFEVDSYELSVFKAGKEKPLIPVYGSDALPAKTTGEAIRFPFVVPPKPYLVRDQAWSADVDFGSLNDRWGNTHHGIF